MILCLFNKFITQILTKISVYSSKKISLWLSRKNLAFKDSKIIRYKNKEMNMKEILQVQLKTKRYFVFNVDIKYIKDIFNVFY